MHVFLLFVCILLTSGKFVFVRSTLLHNGLSANHSKILPRRYDINDLGIADYFHGWADVQGQGAANDYCRLVGDLSAAKIRLSCALAGTYGQSEYNYNSIDNFDVGFPETWYMKDEDNDGRDDYCRCIKHRSKEEYQVICTRAGPKGFYGSPQQGGQSRTFTTTGPIHCQERKVFQEFGRPWGFPLN